MEEFSTVWVRVGRFELITAAKLIKIEMVTIVKSQKMLNVTLETIQMFSNVHIQNLIIVVIST